MKEKVYSLHKLILFVVLFCGLCIGAIGVYLTFIDHEYIWFLVTLICFIWVLFSTPREISKKIVVNSEGISYVFKYPSKINQLNWNEVGSITDDYLEPILFSPKPKFHIIHITPKNHVKKNFRRISISCCIKNHKQLLTEIISRVGPDTYIEDEVYQYLGKGHSKTVTK